jgi:hypothetical protein
MKKKYEGTVYTGVVGPEQDYSVAWRSIMDITRRTGDATPRFIIGTKGYELRQSHINSFIESPHDYLLMLDHDMKFERDTLERLRSHELPYVSGLYMRRQFSPMAPIWFENNPKGLWPMSPFLKPPERGRLHKIGASGWGCILVHRDVILAVRALLKGEHEIIEDDMDIWPYDLESVIGAIRGLRALVDEAPDRRTLLPALKHHTEKLEQEIKPLRCSNNPIGSDIRFPFFAKQAGYQLWGDPDVRAGHILFYPLTNDDYDASPPDFQATIQKDNQKRVRKARRHWRDELARIEGTT